MFYLIMLYHQWIQSEDYYKFKTSTLWTYSGYYCTSIFISSYFLVNTQFSLLITLSIIKAISEIELWWSKLGEMMRNLSRETTFTQFYKARPFVGVVYIQFGLAGLNILFKAALNEGTSNYVFIVYRHAIAAIVIFSPFALSLSLAPYIHEVNEAANNLFHRKKRPKTKTCTSWGWNTQRQNLQHLCATFFLLLHSSWPAY